MAIKESIVYTTSDGTAFNTKNAAEEHEKKLDIIRAITAFDVIGDKISLDKRKHYPYFVTIETEEQRKVFCDIFLSGKRHNVVSPGTYCYSGPAWTRMPDLYHEAICEYLKKQ